MKSKSTGVNSSSGKLHVVATPIGNLGDWSFRAVETAKSVAVISCEDTRVTHKLLAHYGIATPTTAYHEHNAETARPRLLALLAEGKDIALMSDAGTPLISDPGYKLVREAQAAGAEVVAIPGACSAIAALSVAGLPTDAFYFAGFLPHKSKARRDMLSTLADLRATLVFLESPNRLTAALADAQATLGDREACVGRELTKTFEEARRAPLSELITHYEAHPPKGEIVLLVEGAGDAPVERTADTLEPLLTRLLKEHRLKEAVEIACEQTGLPRKEVYALALRIKSDD